MNKRLLAGIDIGGANIKYGLVNSEGSIEYKGKTTTPDSTPPDKLFKKLIYCGERLLVEADDREGKVDYIGVGSPGTVNIETGIIEGACPNLPGWIGFHLRDRLSECMNLPIFIDNDANCATLAEYQFGAGRGYNDIICLTIGTGIGGGIIHDGKINRGSTFAAGEIGHTNIITIDEGVVKQEMLESVVSSRGIIMNLSKKLAAKNTPVFDGLIGNDLGRLSIRKIFSAIKKKDRIAIEVIKSAAEILGSALSNIVNLLNPEIIILGGGIAEGGPIFVDTVEKAVMEGSLPIAAKYLKVVKTELGNDAGFIGASILGDTLNKNLK